MNSKSCLNLNDKMKMIIQISELSIWKWIIVRKFILLMESKGLKSYTKQEHTDRMVEYNIDYDGSNKVESSKGLLKWYHRVLYGNH